MCLPMERGLNLDPGNDVHLQTIQPKKTRYGIFFPIANRERRLKSKRTKRHEGTGLKVKLSKGGTNGSERNVIFVPPIENSRR